MGETRSRPEDSSHTREERDLLEALDDGFLKLVRARLSTELEGKSAELTDQIRRIPEELAPLSAAGSGAHVARLTQVIRDGAAARAETIEAAVSDAANLTHLAVHKDTAKALAKLACGYLRDNFGQRLLSDHAPPKSDSAINHAAGEIERFVRGLRARLGTQMGCLAVELEAAAAKQRAEDGERALNRSHLRWKRASVIVPAVSVILWVCFQVWSCEPSPTAITVSFERSGRVIYDLGGARRLSHFNLEMTRTHDGEKAWLKPTRIILQTTRPLSQPPKLTREPDQHLIGISEPSQIGPTTWEYTLDRTLTHYQGDPADTLQIPSVIRFALEYTR